MSSQQDRAPILPQLGPMFIEPQEITTVEEAEQQAKEFKGGIWRTHYLEVSASNHPDTGTKLPPVFVPPGFGFYFARAINNGWTDNRKNGSNPPLSGWWFEHKGQYIYDANRAQLVAKTPGDNDKGYVEYFDSYDWSKGYRNYHRNMASKTWQLYWYMNDHMERYDDNTGTANIDIVVFRL